MDVTIHDDTDVVVVADYDVGILLTVEGPENSVAVVLRPIAAAQVAQALLIEAQRYIESKQEA